MSKDEIISERRARYEALKLSGREPKTLPGPSPRPAPERHVFGRETIPPGWYATMTMLAGETIRIQAGAVPSSVALLAWRRDDTSERINTADTVKVQWTSALQKGRIVLSDMGRVMLSFVEDSCSCHDALIGGARSPGHGGGRNTPDNLLLAAMKLGLDARDIPPCLTLFAPVRVDAQGRFRWHGERRSAHDYVELRAEMDLAVALSNGPHPLDPAPQAAAVEVLRIAGPPADDGDLCRTATDEARRAFDNLVAPAGQGAAS